MRKLSALITTLLISPLLFCQDTSTTVRLADRSDWWSVLNESFYWPIEKPKGEELSADNLEVAGIKLVDPDPSFRTVKAKFGRAIAMVRGDRSSGRQQVCYASDGKPTVRLIFEQSHSNLSFYLFLDGQVWNGQALCAETSQVTPELRTRSGLHLGMTTAEVEQVLGKPDLVKPTRMVYQRQVEKRTPNDKLAQLRSDHSEMSDADFHENYDSYDLELYIEARFTDGKLIYLAVSKGESY